MPFSEVDWRVYANALHPITTNRIFRKYCVQMVTYRETYISVHIPDTIGWILLHTHTP
jgi:hypothetical protein